MSQSIAVLIADRRRRHEDLHVDGHGDRLKDSPVNGTSAPVFRLMSDS
jgi:hypothetical protein